MKKILALMLTFVLCLSVASLALAEEEATILELETEVDFEAAEFAIGDSGLTIQYPAEWTVTTAEDGSSVTFVSADGTSFAMKLSLGAAVIDDVIGTCNEAVTAGTLRSANECYINGTYYVLTDVDDLTSVAYTDYDGEKVITFTYAAADKDAAAAYSDILMKVLGSLSLPADAE